MTPHQLRAMRACANQGSIEEIHYPKTTIRSLFDKGWIRIQSSETRGNFGVVSIYALTASGQAALNQEIVK